MHTDKASTQGRIRGAQGWKGVHSSVNLSHLFPSPKRKNGKPSKRQVSAPQPFRFRSYPSSEDLSLSLFPPCSKLNDDSSLLFVDIAIRSSVGRATAGVVVSRTIAIGVVVATIRVGVVVSTAAGLCASVVIISLGVGTPAGDSVGSVRGGTGRRTLGRHLEG